MARAEDGVDFKARIVIEKLQETKTLMESAAANELNPNMVRNWKKEFPGNAGMVFDEEDIGREAKRRRRNRRKSRSRCLRRSVS